MVDLVELKKAPPRNSSLSALQQAGLAQGGGQAGFFFCWGGPCSPVIWEPCWLAFYSERVRTPANSTSATASHDHDHDGTLVPPSAAPWAGLVADGMLRPIYDGSPYRLLTIAGGGRLAKTELASVGFDLSLSDWRRPLSGVWPAADLDNPNKLSWAPEAAGRFGDPQFVSGSSAGGSGTRNRCCPGLPAEIGTAGRRSGRLLGGRWGRRIVGGGAAGLR